VAHEGKQVNIEGRDASYSETLARVAALMDAEKIDHQRIANMSADSAIEYLNDAIMSISRALGIAASRAAALVADVLQIVGNAGKVFVESFKAGYKANRRIRPYEG
jgi:hypothetical protein